MNEETLGNIIHDLNDGYTYEQIQQRNNIGREIVFAVTQSSHVTVFPTTQTNHLNELLKQLELVKPGMKSKEILEIMK